jgi:branched-chain amino acid transport system substrate-binding protein
VLRADAAAAIASQAVEAAIAEKKSVADRLMGTAWQTALGPITFGSNHELTVNPFRFLQWNGKDFQPADGATD